MDCLCRVADHVAGQAIRPAGILAAAGFGLVAARSALAGRIRWTRAILTTLAIGVPLPGAFLAIA